jgi:hypothetical protein
MGFEDEVEQSLGRPCHQTNGRSKRTYELTSSIVPDNGQQATVQDAELLAKYPPDNQQRLDKKGQVGEVLDQLAT